ncbi:uncharacterized protein PODANS_3_11260 [Podospora anserina S mat+]|uniref:Podospora anserina S mat+ genomic DNA chromosome 3, supercontig 3 n=1 Tax=Podospora anserina (strain S / ATCC MYA-4624 / DSM 980 / FGSC 10383) TaxID=515849 RepID=B2ACW1_PODAN|nr:uncharacterized protein PODANS_3_11260 [Podospora anserina S mat+]CAP61276.1 unnamed protein product [Podospora anserina S mat+]CDP27630.1 Putative protein of unknown function [Podospora anserina S mat+]
MSLRRPGFWARQAKSSYKNQINIPFSHHTQTQTPTPTSTLTSTSASTDKMHLHHLALLGAIPLSLAHPSPSTPSITELFAYPPTNPIFLENLLPLPDSRLLLSSFSPSLLLFSPNSPTTPTALTPFPNCTSYTGLTSLSPTTYAVTGGVMAGLGFDPTTTALHIFSLPPNSTTPTLLNSIPLNYPLPNGLLALPSNKSIILSADSLTGSILRIDTTTNTVTTILQSPQLLGGTVFPLGINGLAARPLFDGYLYFTVSGQGYFGRIKLSNQGYIPSGSQIQVLAQIQDPGWVNAFDDLDFDHTGKSAYIAWQRGRVVKVTQGAWGQQWTQEAIVNGTEDVTLKGVTAVKFAKGWSGRKVLFATTGGLEGENDQVGGQVVRIDL